MTSYLRRLAWVVAVLFIVLGLMRLRFDVDVLNLLPGNLPAVQGLKLHQKHFANANELIITLNASDADAAEKAARGLAEVLRMRGDLVRSATWQAPWVENPPDAAEFIAHLWLNQSPEHFGQLTNRLLGGNALLTLRETQQRLATTLSPNELARLPYDPFDLFTLPDSSGPAMNSDSDLFSSPDGTFRLVYVQAARPLTNYRQAMPWTAQIKAVIQSWQQQQVDGPVKIQMTGGPAFTSEIAGGMEREMSTSVFSTALVIAVLFWWVHRRWKPLIWLLTLLLLILIGTMSLGGWVIGTLNVVSAGFAAILFGLGDYGLVLYQEAQAHPERSLLQIRRELAPSIFWSAITTAGGFLLLSFSGLPGLGQLGTLVAMGVGLAAIVMVFAYLPLVADAARQPLVKGSSAKPLPLAWALALTFGVVLAGFAVLMFALPKVDYSSKPLRPRKSEAYAAIDQIRTRLGHRDPYWLMIPGTNEHQVGEKLTHLQTFLAAQATAGKIERYELPVSLWPNLRNQSQNVLAASAIVAAGSELHRVASEAGFTTNALLLTDRILAYWARADGSGGVVWPSSGVSRWILDKFTARTPGQAIALGLVYSEKPEELTASLEKQGIWVAGWENLGRALFGVVQRHFWYVFIPMLALVILTLWLAFRSFRDILLSLATLALSLLSLLVVMRLAGWSWNLLNMLAVPLLLGAGVDYSIHMLAALRRHGTLGEVLRSTGQAILLVGGTTIAGFGSLAWSSNAGLASLGVVTASGLSAAMLISVFLLPHWWKLLGGNTTAEPSALYRASFWRAGLGAARILPVGLLNTTVQCLAWLYWLLARERREVVRRNLAPALGDPKAGAKAARELFQQFAIKLVDIWRFEAGKPIDDTLFQELTGWDHFTAAHGRGQGVLLITPHLGNWEFGGPLLVRRGIKLHVITLREPGENFTEMRQASRARWGIDTLVIGNDPFAFVEIIKKLQSGATVALLVDRPPAASAVHVELFGQRFCASAAAAELARATGCALVPVVLPRGGRGYAAHVLPEIPYDRAALGKRDARAQLTQQIMRAFEPFIRQYLTQWYHFVPIWPDNER